MKNFDRLVKGYGSGIEYGQEQLERGVPCWRCLTGIAHDNWRLAAMGRYFPVCDECWYAYEVLVCGFFGIPDELAYEATRRLRNRTNKRRAKE